MRQISPKLSRWLSIIHSAHLAHRDQLQPSVNTIRENIKALVQSMSGEVVDVAHVCDASIAGTDFAVPVRIYHPQPGQRRPVIIFYHGGGGIAGSIDIYDPICRRLTRATGHIVVSAEYRLAPEHPFPAGLNDAYSAAKGVWQTLDRCSLSYAPRLSLVGDSHGGGLASMISCGPQENLPQAVTNQVLIYPALDYTLGQPSIGENGNGYFLTKASLEAYVNNYFSGAEDRYFHSPLFQQIPPTIARTLVVSAEFDPLRDEAVEYVARLTKAGGSCRHLHLDSMVHGFLYLESLVKDECQSVYDAIADFLHAPADLRTLAQPEG